MVRSQATNRIRNMYLESLSHEFFISCMFQEILSSHSVTVQQERMDQGLVDVFELFL